MLRHSTSERCLQMSILEDSIRRDEEVKYVDDVVRKRKE